MHGDLNTTPARWRVQKYTVVVCCAAARGVTYLPRSLGLSPPRCLPEAPRCIHTWAPLPPSAAAPCRPSRRRAQAKSTANLQNTRTITSISDSPVQECRGLSSGCRTERRRKQLETGCEWDCNEEIQCPAWLCAVAVIGYFQRGLPRVSRVRERHVTPGGGSRPQGTPSGKYVKTRRKPKSRRKIENKFRYSEGC